MLKAKTPNTRLIVLLIAGLIILAVFVDRLHLPFAQTATSVREYITGFGIFAPAIYILLMTGAIIVVPVPDFVIGLAGAILFPWYLATLYTLIADFIGSTIVFYVARIFGRPLVIRMVREKDLNKLDSLASRLGGKTVFFLRLIPGFNFDLIGYLAGMTTMDYKIYIIATMLGIVPRRVGTYYIVDKGILVDPVFIFLGILLSMILAPLVIYWLWKDGRDRV